MLVAVLALALIFSLLGFLPLNIARARVFLGDTGALFIGFWLAGIALMYIENGPPGALYAVVLIFMPWLSDILLTMAWRARHRHDLLSAHNDHLYQLFLRRGLSHGQMAFFMALQSAVCVMLAWVFRASATSELLALTAIAVFAVIIHWWARAIMANPASGDNEAAPEH
jgi:UDP-N-acetylmuramyl pentapeptide phosphotransferase/UDP-N-acetylglucosamine-1-phosphate transferase